MPLGRTPRRVGARVKGRLLKAYAAEPANDVARKVKHIAKLLESAELPYSEDLAAAWIAPFNDESDPSFSVEQWLAAGWRDPRLVAAALSIFGNLARAQACMEMLGADPGSFYDAHLVRLMLEAHEWLSNAS